MWAWEVTEDQCWCVHQTLNSAILTAEGQVPKKQNVWFFISRSNASVIRSFAQKCAFTFRGSFFFLFISWLLIVCSAIKRTHFCPCAEDEKKASVSKCALQKHQWGLGHPMALFPLASLNFKCWSKQLFQLQPEWSKGDYNRLGCLDWENTLLFYPKA